MPDHLAHELGVRALVEGRRGRQEVGRLPHLTSWLAHPSGPSPEAQFSLGLGFLLDGIARCLAEAETQARSDTMGG